MLPALPDRKIQAMSLELATLILRIKVAGLMIQGTNLGPAALVLQKTLAHRIKAMDLGPVALRRKIRATIPGLAPLILTLKIRVPGPRLIALVLQRILVRKVRVTGLNPVAPRRKIQATILELALLILMLRIRALGPRLMGRVLRKMLARRIRVTGLRQIAPVLQRVLAHRIRAMDLGPALRRKIQS